MADILRTEERSCASSQCPASMTLTYYNCSCVKVVMHNEAEACDTCLGWRELLDDPCDDGIGEPENHDA